jgi:ABC-2 type transport system ATP-binding protein
LVPQDLAIYEDLTARENLAFFGALHGLGGGALKDRIAWALGIAGLADRADEPAKAYSGGMKRRLNLAAGLLHKPKLLILDEPTVGVDPQSRNHIFEAIKALRKDGMTILYTSHYMEEVQALCDRIAIMDGGKIVAQGRVDELLASHVEAGFDLEIAGDEFAITSALTMAAAFAEVERDGRMLRVEPTGPLAPVINAIEGAGVKIVTIHSRRPDLEAVFLELTGKKLRDAD